MKRTSLKFLARYLSILWCSAFVACFCIEFHSFAQYFTFAPSLFVCLARAQIEVGINLKTANGVYGRLCFKSPQWSAGVEYFGNLFIVPGQREREGGKERRMNEIVWKMKLMEWPWNGTGPREEEKINVRTGNLLFSLCCCVWLCRMSIVNLFGRRNGWRRWLWCATKRRDDHPFRIMSVPEFSPHNSFVWEIFVSTIVTSFWFGRCITRLMGKTKNDFLFMGHGQLKRKIKMNWNSSNSIIQSEHAIVDLNRVRTIESESRNSQTDSAFLRTSNEPNGESLFAKWNY